MSLAVRGGMPHPRRPATATLVALAAVVVTVLTGCSGTVRAAAPPGSQTRACENAASAWPSTVADRERRSTSASSPAVVAWGDPPVIARCGVTPPAPTTDECLRVDDVDWVARRLSDGVRFTTYGRVPAIEVLVPSELSPETLLLPAFREAASALPRQPGRECS